MNFDLRNTYLITFSNFSVNTKVSESEPKNAPESSSSSSLMVGISYKQTLVTCLVMFAALCYSFLKSFDL